MLALLLSGAVRTGYHLSVYKADNLLLARKGTMRSRLFFKTYVTVLRNLTLFQIVQQGMH